MKRFGIYRKLILIAGTVIAAVSVGAMFLMESISSLMLLVICAFVILCGLLFLHDFLHNRYHDDLLEQIALLIEALVEQFDSTESNADAGKGADQNADLRYFPPDQNACGGGKYLCTVTG